MINKLTTESEKLEFLHKTLSKLFDKNFKVSIDDNLYDLGLDSLDIIELQVEYEEGIYISYNEEDASVRRDTSLPEMQYYYSPRPTKNDQQRDIYNLVH